MRQTASQETAQGCSALSASPEQTRLKLRRQLKRCLLFVSCLSGLSASGCRPSASQQKARSTLTTSTHAEVKPAPHVVELVVKSARFELTLPASYDAPAELTSVLSMSWPSAAREGYFNFTLPRGVNLKLPLEQGCELEMPKAPPEAILHPQVRCRREGSAAEQQVSLRYERPLSELSAYLELDEGERRYGLLTLSPQEWPSLFLGAHPHRDIQRNLRVTQRLLSREQGDEPQQLVAVRLGREAREGLPLEEASEPSLGWSWERRGPLREPLILLRGDWERPVNSSESQHPLSLFAPAGSAQHTVAAQPFSQAQLKLLERSLMTLEQLALTPKPSAQDTTTLWCLTLPFLSASKRLQLSEWGVMSLPEAWFQRALTQKRSLTPQERSLALHKLLELFIPPQRRSSAWVKGAIAWAARRLSLKQAQRDPELSELEALQHTISLDPIFELTPPKSAQRAAQLIEMAHQWLKHKAEDAQGLDEATLLSALLKGEGELLSAVSAASPQLKPQLQALLERADSPLIGVSWRWDEPSSTLKLTLSSEGQLIPFMCVRLGFEGEGAPSTEVRCLPGAQLIGSAHQDHSLQLARRPLWLHPNASQAGFYRWSLSDEALTQLIKGLKRGALSEREWGSLPEVISQLMSLGRATPDLYLESIDALSLQALSPSALSLLLAYLNRAVHELSPARGAEAKQQDPLRQWAAARLQGVMFSEERFQAPPTSHLISLQLAEWEPVGTNFLKGALSKTELKRLKELLSSTSSADMIAGSSARSDVASLQYPLLLKARAGDEPLWAQVAQLFAVSDDEPVARLLSLQALSTFPPPLLFKTLTLLLSSSQEQEHEHEHEHEHERQEVTSDKDKTAEAQAQEAQAQEDKGAAQELEAEEEEPLEPSLKRDEVLTLVRAVRSLSGKRAAWAWLSEQLTKPNAEPLLGFEQLNVQRALIQWGRASCDEAGVELMERAARAELGFSPELAPEAQLALKLMRRCLKLQAAHPRVTTWAKRALKMK